MDGMDALLGMLVLLVAPAVVYLALIRGIGGGEPVDLTALYRYPDPRPRPGSGSQDDAEHWDPRAVVAGPTEQTPGISTPRVSDGAGGRRVAARPGRRSSAGAEQLG